MPARERILVLMDTSSADPALLKFLRFIVEAHDTQEVHVFNSISQMNIPDEVLKDFPEIKEKAVEERIQLLTDKVNELLPEEVAAICQVHVKQGAPAKEILKFVDKNNIALIMMGRLKNFAGGGVLSNRLARRAACNLFIIPEDSTVNVNLLHVPCDFSPHSKIAMEEAIRIARHHDGETTIICQNVYTVPGGYHYSGKTYEEFAEVMKANAEKDFKRFMADIDAEGVNIEVVYSLDTNDNPVTDIVDFANYHRPGAIIIGVKGRSSATALFIGSRAEHLIQQNSQIPMMVVRPKGKNAGIMDLLKEI